MKADRRRPARLLGKFMATPLWIKVVVVLGILAVTLALSALVASLEQ